MKMSAWLPRPLQQPHPVLPAAPATSLIKWRAKKAGAFRATRVALESAGRPAEHLWKKPVPNTVTQSDIVYIRLVYIDEDESRYA